MRREADESKQNQIKKLLIMRDFSHFTVENFIPYGFCTTIFPRY